MKRYLLLMVLIAAVSCVRADYSFWADNCADGHCNVIKDVIPRIDQPTTHYCTCSG
jgi:hypothetical protein